MNITVNDKPVIVPPLTSLADVMAERDITPAGIAVAVNGNAITPTLWKSTMLCEGDSILVFKAFYGG